MVNFLMYLDANYLHKSIVAYESLKKTYDQPFKMFIYCFDEVVYDVYSKLQYPEVALIKKEEFEISEILNQKSTKKSYEYYWTYTPKLIEDTLKKVAENDIVIYIDSDMMFYSSVDVIIEELEDKDVLIQPNNFSVKERWQFEPVGYYCVAFNVFRNNENSRKIVSEWKEQCIKWCASSFEENRFGDQKYLDYWRDTYKNVRETTIVGANIAPWNIHKFDVSTRNGQVMLNNSKLVYYHFHAFKMNFEDYSYIIEGDRNNHYDIREDAIENIYIPYIDKIKSAIQLLKTFDSFKSYILLNPKGDVGYYDSKD